MSGTSTAWGSWMSPANPTLRDTHEYILVFQKPPFGRKRPEGRESTISRDDFLEYTKSTWSFAPTSAKRAQHPAPFPVELPRRLIDLYTFSDEVVLDPFMGSGATALAALDFGRVFVGYEISQEYVDVASVRLSEAAAQSDPVVIPNEIVAAIANRHRCLSAWLLAFCGLGGADCGSGYFRGGYG